MTDIVEIRRALLRKWEALKKEPSLWRALWQEVSNGLSIIADPPAEPDWTCYWLRRIYLAIFVLIFARIAAPHFK